MEQPLPTSLAVALGELGRSRRYRLLSPPKPLNRGEWSFQVAVGPEQELVAASNLSWFEFEMLCPSAFPFKPCHARPIKPLLRWFPHQNGHWDELGTDSDILCPPPIYQVGTLPTLKPYLDYYRCWVEDALAGRLVKPEERYELPHLFYSIGFKRIIYVDGGQAALEWVSTNRSGVALILPVRLPGPHLSEIVAVKSLFPTSDSTLTFSTCINDSLIDSKPSSLWAPWAFVGSPVAEKPHRPHLNWSDLTSWQAGRIEQAVAQWLGFDSEKRATFILLGFGVQRVWGRKDFFGVHWQAVDLSRLPKQSPKQAGFRKKPPPGHSHIFYWLNRSQADFKRLVTRDISREALNMRTPQSPSDPLRKPFLISNIVILGIGALGGCIAKGLIHSIPGNVVLVDSDSLEPGNLVRHEAPAICLEKNKATAMQVMLNGIGSDHRVTAVDKDIITCWDELLPQLRGADFIIDTTGNRAVSEKLSRSSELCGATIAWAYIKPGPEWGVLALRTRSVSTTLQDAENSLKAGAVSDWNKIETQSSQVTGLVWPEPGCYNATFAAPYYRVRMLADSMIATILAWFGGGASSSMVTLYHQYESTTFSGIETTISGQFEF